MRKHLWLKKTVASLLTLTMLLGVAPFTVFAAPDAATAAEQALEERVFEIGGEQLTIEDLEECAGVFVTNEAGQVSIIAGSDIRTYLLANNNAFPGGTATFQLVQTTSMTAQIRMTITSDNLNISKITGRIYCSDRSQQVYYYREPNSTGTTTLWQASTLSPSAKTVTKTFANFTLAQGSTVRIGIVNLDVTFVGSSLHGTAGEVWQNC